MITEILCHKKLVYDAVRLFKMKAGYFKLIAGMANGTSARGLVLN